MKQGVGRTRRKLYSIAAAVVLLWVGAVTQAHAATVTYYACVNNSTGAITIVSATTTCKTGFHKIQWNQLGPQGPKGPAGPTGPQGPQGPSGISVGAVTTLQDNLVSLGGYALILQTDAVPMTGTYYINATALLSVDAANTGGILCFVTPTSDGRPDDLYGGASTPGQLGQAAIADYWPLNAGDSIQLWCYSSDANDMVDDASLWMVLVDTSNGTARKSFHSHRALSGSVKTLR
jgi:hypothetical protein